MKRLSLILVFLWAWSWSASAAPAIMPPSEVRAGMHGYGRTVFHGTTVEQFPVTILGVVHHFLAEQDLILFKIDGGYLKQKGLGIVAGMSGSPVYIDGRVIGAVAYGWAYAKEPIGGITPITAMLEELPGGTPAQASDTGEARPLPAPLRLHGQEYRYIALQSHTPVSSDTLTLRPAGSLLQLRGWSPRSIDRLQKLFSGSDMMPVSTMMLTGADPPSHGPLPPLVPGSSIGVQLLSGDLDISATGTLTYLDGKKFVAFGHPMSQMGQVHIPLTEAYVYNIYPSAQNPFKIASQLGVVGELSTDYFYAIGGTVGVHPPTLPVTMTIDDSQRHMHKVLHLHVFDHPFFAPGLIGIAASQAIGSSATLLGDTTARISYEVQTGDGAAPLHFSDTDTGMEIDLSVSNDVSSVIRKLTVNDFTPTHLQSVALHVELSPGRKSAVIEKIVVDQTRYLPGELMTVGVQVKPFDQPSVLRTFKVPIPIDAEKGSVKLAVSSGQDMAAVRKRLSISESHPTSMSEVYRDVVDADKNDELILSCVFNSSGAVFGADKYAFLPQSLRDVIPVLNSSAVVPEKDLYQVRQSVPWVLSGSQTVSFDVDVPKDNTGFRPTRMATEPARPATADAKPTTGKAAIDLAPTIVSGPDVKVLPTGTHRWMLSDSTFLFRGRLDGVTVSDDGQIALGPHITTVSSSLPDVAWAMASGPEGTVAVAYGPPSRILIEHGGTTRSVNLPANSVHSLLVDASGTIWAGTGPKGLVYKIPPHGEPTVAFNTGAHYVWALAQDAHGDILAGTGLPGAVYRVSGASPSQLVETPEPHVKSLAVLKDGTLVLGTANRGAIYELRGQSLRPVYSTVYGSVDGLTVTDSQTVVAGSGKDLYELDGDSVRITELKTGPIMSVLSSAGKVYAGTGDGRIYAAQGGVAQLVEDSQAGPTMALASETGGDVLALHASPAEVHRLSSQPSPQGSYESPVLDATDTARWGAIRWDGPAEVWNRSGDTSQPDATWSDWTKAVDHVTSPDGRYLQVRAVLKGHASLQGVTVYYRPHGRLPHVTFNVPVSGDAWSGKHRIFWKTDLGYREDLAFDVEATSDGGKSWKPIEMGHRAAVKEHAVGNDDHAAGDDFVDWDTKTFADGDWRLRITVRDLQDNKGATFLSPEVAVVNHPPHLDVKAAHAEGSTVRVEGTAHAERIAIQEVAYRLEGGEWHTAQAVDGLFDSPTEAFTVTQPFTGKKPAYVELRVVDEAGNSQTTRKEL